MRFYLSENKEHSPDQTDRSVEKVAAQGHFHEKQAEKRKDGHGDHFLHDLKLRQSKVLGA